MVIKETRTFRRFLRTIASTAVSGIGHWDRAGSAGADLCLTCHGDDGRKLMAVNQLDDGHVEVFVSSTLQPSQYVTAHEGLCGVFIDQDVLGEGIDEALSADWQPPLMEATNKIKSLARSLDGVDVKSENISDGLIGLRLIDEYRQRHLIFLVANESGHFCYYRNDVFDLALAMLAAACYQTGFHLCMLSKTTGIHRVKAFRGTQQEDELLAFDIGN